MRGAYVHDLKAAVRQPVPVDPRDGCRRRDGGDRGRGEDPRARLPPEPGAALPPVRSSHGLPSRAVADGGQTSKTFITSSP